MRSSGIVFVIFGLVAFGTCMTHTPSRPVYTRNPSVVSVVGSPMPAGKSLVAPSDEVHAQPAQLHQPVAEERESVLPAQDPGAPAGAGSAVQPQTFNIVYYPNGGPLQNGQGATYPASVPYMPEQQVSAWEKYHMTDIAVALVSVAAVVGGGFLLVPKILNLRGSRSLQELAEKVSTDDVARIARSVFKAFEKYQSLNAVNVE